MGSARIRTNHANLLIQYATRRLCVLIIVIHMRRRTRKKKNSNARSVTSPFAAPTRQSGMSSDKFTCAMLLDFERINEEKIESLCFPLFITLSCQNKTRLNFNYGFYRSGKVLPNLCESTPTGPYFILLINFLALDVDYTILRINEIASNFSTISKVQKRAFPFIC